MTTHPPAPIPTERGTAVENESDRDMTGPEQMAARAPNETTDPAGRCADCGGAGVIEVDSADEHRDFQPCRCATDPTAGERDNWNPVTSTPSCDWCGECDWCDNLHRPAEPDAGHVEAIGSPAGSPNRGDGATLRFGGSPSLPVAAEPDAGDVETLARVLSGATPEFAARAAENHMTQARRLLVSDWLAAHDAAVRRKAADDRAERRHERLESAVEALADELRRSNFEFMWRYADRLRALLTNGSTR